jgi:hypothetical protein
MKITAEKVRWFRIRRSGLVAQFPSPVQAAEALVGVQAQILQAAGLALWNRSPGVSEAALDDLLYRSRSLVRIWGQRGTLHLFACGDWPLMIGALSQRLSRWDGVSAPFGLPREQYGKMLTEVERLLKGSESLGRKGLLGSGLPINERCCSPWGGIYADLVMRGLACHVRRAGGEGRFAHRHNWLPDLEWTPPPHDEANIELTRRYARTYGPVAEKDLAYWRGARVTDVRGWLRELDGELGTVEHEGEELRYVRGDARTLGEKPPSRGVWPLIMLYRFDPLLMGYRDRSWILDDEFRDRVSRAAGHIEGTVLGPEDGTVCATWRYTRGNGGMTVLVEPFRKLPSEVRRAIKVRRAASPVTSGCPSRRSSSPRRSSVRQQRIHVAAGPVPMALETWIY